MVVAGAPIGVAKNGARFNPPPNSLMDKTEKRPTAGKDLSFFRCIWIIRFYYFAPSIISSDPVHLIYYVLPLNHV